MVYSYDVPLGKVSCPVVMAGAFLSIAVGVDVGGGGGNSTRYPLPVRPSIHPDPNANKINETITGKLRQGSRMAFSIGNRATGASWHIGYTSGLFVR
jgi:hypothetical protein